MVVSENIFVHLCRNGLTTVARHIEETLGSSFAKGNRQFQTSSKDRQTVRVFKNSALCAVSLNGVGCCLLAAWVFGDTSLA